MRRLFALFLVAAAVPGVVLAQQTTEPGGMSGVGPRPPSPADAVKTTAPPRTAACDPSFGGKYDGLIRQLTIPEDEAQYGRCHDYGPWAGSQYKGHTKLPANAFWTYSAPNWYVWARRGGADASGACPDPTFGGKYSGELRRLEIPQDRVRYGGCNDYGGWSGSTYAGHTDLPRGYWVYSYPYWIIYARRAGQ